jgi:hypothetical protein
MPTKIWAVGEEVLANDFNTMVQQQIVATFPNAAARTAAVAAPLPGMLTFLADTGVYESWSGAAWLPLAGPGRSQLAYKLNATQQSGIQTVATDVVGLSATVTVPAGRRIQLAAYVGFYKAGADVTGYATAQITDGANTVLRDANQNIAVNFYASVYTLTRVEPAAGTFTWKVRAATNAGFVNILAGSLLIVDDVGPASLPD